MVPEHLQPLKYKLYELLEKELQLLALLAQLTARNAPQREVQQVTRLHGLLHSERIRLAELL
ncbi:MAG TPA: hypothetical protein VHL79_14115 [Ramlibacter sp.]|jgi:hypothetical protein|nr:hypothetical protein [Ramlibacter sp.]